MSKTGKALPVLHEQRHSRHPTQLIFDDVPLPERALKHAPQLVPATLTRAELLLLAAAGDEQPSPLLGEVTNLHHSAIHDTIGVSPSETLCDRPQDGGFGSRHCPGETSPKNTESLTNTRSLASTESLTSTRAQGEPDETVIRPLQALMKSKILPSFKPSDSVCLEKIVRCPPWASQSPQSVPRTQMHPPKRLRTRQDIRKHALSHLASRDAKQRSRDLRQHHTRHSHSKLWLFSPRHRHNIGSALHRVPGRRCEEHQIPRQPKSLANTESLATPKHSQTPKHWPDRKHQIPRPQSNPSPTPKHSQH